MKPKMFGMSSFIFRSVDPVEGALLYEGTEWLLFTFTLLRLRRWMRGRERRDADAAREMPVINAHTPPLPPQRTIGLRLGR